MSYFRLPISVTLKAPWCIPGGSLAGQDVDIRLARNFAGHFILPGSLLRGVVRGAAKSIAEKVSGGLDILEGRTIAGLCKAAFGEESTDHNKPERGFAIVGDLVADEVQKTGHGRSVRVEIEPERGSAKEGHLVFVECPCRHGTTVTFSGEIVVTGPESEANARCLAKLLEITLPRVYAMGGMKSVGFGKLIEFRVDPMVRQVTASAKAPASNISVYYMLDRPFLVNTSRLGGNYEVSSDTLPGTAIKAVSARAFADRGKADMAEAFLAALHVSDAPPTGASQDAIARAVPPLSLAIEQRSQSEKVILCSLHASKSEGLRRFAPDWKKREQEGVSALLSDRGGAAFSVEPLPTEARTRTAIDHETGGALIREDTGGALFSERLVVPGDRRWSGTLRGEPSLMDEVCEILSTGAPGFGSTGAVLSGDIKALEEREHLGGDEITLTLQSHAHLFFGHMLRERLIKTRDALAELYRAYFDTLELDLVDFRAAQTLVGGYLAQRYPVNAEVGYQPWMVTSAGSTFQLRVRTEANLSDILRHGLPPVMPKGASWRTFPFMREVGFGAVRDDTGLLEDFGKGIPL